MGLQTHAFLGEEAWLNLYNIIDEWYIDLKNKNFIYELSWTDNSIKDRLNTLITLEYAKINQEVENCLHGDFAPSHIEEIAFWNTQVLFNKLWDWCKSNSNSVSIETLDFIQKVIYQHYIDTKNLADEKAEQIQKISSVWLYTDWILENSSFDLINDIEQIDSIIFSQKNTYIGEEYTNFNDLFENQQAQKKENINNNTDDLFVLNENNELPASKSANINNINALNLWNNLSIWDSIFSTSSNYVCTEDWNHGLSIDALDNLFNNNWSWISKVIENDRSNIEEDNIIFDTTDELSNIQWENIEWTIANYSKVNDNALWPCSNFFCITVEFVIHEQKLLWWWEDISIEYLLDRSNQHLKKFANTSLIPAKITTQNFELALKDLNLSEIFHMSFQISTKPVPILSVNKNNNPDSNEFTASNLIEKYYAANNLNYQRANDITIIQETEEEYKTLLNSVNLDKRVLIEKQEILDEYKRLQTLKSQIITDNIYEKISYDTLWDFWDQFIELNNFSNEIRNYTQNLSNLIEAMIKIPIDW